MDKFWGSVRISRAVEGNYAHQVPLEKWKRFCGSRQWMKKEDEFLPTVTQAQLDNLRAFVAKIEAECQRRGLSF